MIKLAKQIGRDRFDEIFGGSYCAMNGRSALLAHDPFTQVHFAIPEGDAGTVVFTDFYARLRSGESLAPDESIDIEGALIGLFKENDIGVMYVRDGDQWLATGFEAPLSSDDLAESCLRFTLHQDLSRPGQASWYLYIDGRLLMYDLRLAESEPSCLRELVREICKGNEIEILQRHIWKVQ